MSRKRNHRMRAEVRQHMQAGLLKAVTPDHLASLNQLHTEEVVAAKMVSVRAALVRYLEGNAGQHDHALIGGEMNTCWFAAALIEGGAIVQERLLAAGEVLNEAVRIREQHGRYGLTGPGRIALGMGVDAIELVLQATSPRQMASAEEALDLARRHQRKAA